MARSKCTVVLSKHEWDWLAKDLRLSARQVEIARFISQGMGDKEIAWRLGVSFGTVRTHLSRLFQKCDVRDRLELLARIYATLNASRRDHAAPLSPREDDADSCAALWVQP